MTKSDLGYAIVLGIISGGMVGVVAGLVHRAQLFGVPVGLLGSVVMIIAFVVFNRTIGGRPGLAAGLIALAGVLGALYASPLDRIILPDGFGMLLSATVTLAGVLGLAWPASRGSDRSLPEGGTAPTPAP